MFSTIAYLFAALPSRISPSLRRRSALRLEAARQLLQLHFDRSNRKRCHILSVRTTTLQWWSWKRSNRWGKVKRSWRLELGSQQDLHQSRNPHPSPLSLPAKHLLLRHLSNSEAVRSVLLTSRISIRSLQNGRSMGEIQCGISCEAVANKNVDCKYNTLFLLTSRNLSATCLTNQTIKYFWQSLTSPRTCWTLLLPWSVVLFRFYDWWSNRASTFDIQWRILG